MRSSADPAARARRRSRTARGALAACLLLAGCRSIFGLEDPTVAGDGGPGGRADAPAIADGTDGPGPTDAGGYRATAVRFDEAGNDYMSTGMLANTGNSPRGTLSVWLRFHGGDGTQQLVIGAQVVAAGGVLRRSDDRFELVMANCVGAVLLDLESQGTYTTASGWVHLLASWDVSMGRAQLYINDVASMAADPTIHPGDICYASLKWGIGGLSSGQLDADVADLYAALGTSIDLDVAANRRRFSDLAGKPVELGDHCMRPTGTIPTGCFIGAASTWNTNKGTGAGFTLNGDGLAPAPTSPSD